MDNSRSRSGPSSVHERLLHRQPISRQSNADTVRLLDATGEVRQHLPGALLRGCARDLFDQKVSLAAEPAEVASKSV